MDILDNFSSKPTLTYHCIKEDCNNSCMTNQVFDCSGVCGGDATEENSRSFPTKILDSGTNNSFSKNYTNENMSNSSGSSINLSGANYGDQFDMAGVERSTDLEEYVLLLFDNKPNKIYLNIKKRLNNVFEIV